MNNINRMLMVLGSFFVMNLSAGFIEGENFVKYSKELSVRLVDNQTLHSSFKIFYANKDSLGLVSSLSTMLLTPSELFLQQDELLCIKCVKGEFLSIYIQNQGKASGIAPEGFHGPYYLTMWLNYPIVSDDQKVIVRYCVANEDQGVSDDEKKHSKQHAEIGIRINQSGDCQILALKNIQLLP